MLKMISATEWPDLAPHDADCSCEYCLGCHQPGYDDHGDHCPCYKCRSAVDADTFREMVAVVDEMNRESMLRSAIRGSVENSDGTALDIGDPAVDRIADAISPADRRTVVDTLLAAADTGTDTLPGPESAFIHAIVGNAVAAVGTAELAELMHQREVRRLYGDVAALLDGTMPEAPKPTVLTRSDGHPIFYKGEFNNIDGDPGDGKTFILLSAMVEEVNGGGRVLFIDMDHNGLQAIVDKLIRLGADPEKLRSTDHFRYVEPEDPQHLNEVVVDCVSWAPGVAGFDCVGELMGLYGGNNDNADDYTRIVNTAVLPLVKAGAAAILIDHLAKGKDSRDYGSGGTMAKKRKLGGISVRVVPIEKLTPGRGGKLRLIGRKDRHGAVSRHCPPTKGGFDIGDFVVTEDPDTGTMRAAVWPREDRQFVELAPGACGPIRNGDRDFLAAADELTDAKGDAGFTVTELTKVHYNTVEVSTPQRNTARHAVNRLVTSGYLRCVHEGAKGAHDPARYAATAEEADE